MTRIRSYKGSTEMLLTYLDDINILYFIRGGLIEIVSFNDSLFIRLKDSYKLIH